MATSADGRVLTRDRWRAGGWPCVNIQPYDLAYFRHALQRVACEFGIPMPEIAEADPEERGGWTADFTIGAVRAGAIMNGRRCSIAADSEALRDRIFTLLAGAPD